METVRQLEHDLDHLREHYASMSTEVLDSLTPEQRHRLYDMLGLASTMTPEGALELELGAVPTGKGEVLCGMETRFSAP